MKKRFQNIDIFLLVGIIISLSSCGMLTSFNLSNDTFTMDTERNIGINLFAVQADYTKDRMFADAMKTARIWTETGDYSAGTGEYGNGDPIPDSLLDDNGWPLTDAECVVWGGMNNMHGTYYLELESDVQPKVSFNHTAGARIVSSSYSNGIYSAKVQIDNSASCALLLTVLNTGNGFKNVKFMKPVEPGATEWYSTDTTFTDQCKKLVENASVVRFLWPIDGWNGPWQIEWDERVQPDYCSFNRGASSETYVFWAGYGIPWEYGIQFCNETEKDMWLVLPAGASDDYIRNLAQLVKDEYKVSGGKIYWEYTNEATWATSVHGKISDWLRAQGQAEVDAGGPVGFDGITNINMLGVRWHAKRALEMSLIWRDVWGDNAMMSTIRPILSGHADYNDQNQWALDFIFRYYGNKTGENVADPHPVNYYFYGTGGDFYTGDNPDGDSTIQLVINGSEQTVSGSEIDLYEVYVESESCLAKTYGLERCSYEGGVWTTAENYQMDRIEDAMIRYQRLWDKYDGDLLVYYVSTGGEDGGKALGFSLDGIDLDTPKYRALSYLDATKKAAIGGGTLAPCTIDGANFSTHYVPWMRPLPQFMESSGRIELNTYNKYVGYLVRVDDSGTYGIQIDYNTLQDVDYEITVDGATLHRANALGTGHDVSNMINTNMSSGLHSVAIRVYADSGDAFYLNKIIISE